LGDSNFEWERFEAFCREFVSLVNDGAPCHHYGKKGNKQRGIDLVCILPSGQKRVYQCRQWKEYSKTQAEKTIKDTTYVAKDYTVLLSCEASADVRDVFSAQPAWDVSDVRDISFEVRQLPAIKARKLLKQHFGIHWVTEFLGRSVPRLSLVQTNSLSH